MSRGNIVLSIVLVVVAGAWLLTRESESEKQSGPAQKLFPTFNKEAVDSIVIEGGWEGTRWIFSRLGSQWTLASAGGYPVKADTVNEFIEAVYHLRKDAFIGATKKLRDSSHTGDRGRVVRMIEGKTPKAEFRIGKSPEDSGQTFFVRKESEDDVYRTRTLLTKDLEEAPQSNSRWNFGASGYRWTDFTRRLAEWVDTEIWRLGDAEVSEIMLDRKDAYTVTIRRKGDEEWELQEMGGKEWVPADTDSASGISDDLRYLNLVDVLGRFEDVNAEYGLDKPELSLVLTMKQKIKKEAEPEKKDGDEKEGEDKEKEKKDEFKIVKRTLMVGRKIKRPDSFDDEKGARDETYYAIHIGGEFDDKELERRSKYVFLVDATTLRGLRRELDELKQKPAEEEKKDEPSETEPKKDDVSKDEGAAEKKDDAEPTKDEPAEPKRDDAAEPTKDEPAEPKKAETDEPKKDDAEPKKDEPADPKKDDGG